MAKDGQRTRAPRIAVTNTRQYRARRCSVLVAGGPGAGKSTVSQALRDQGFRSVDLDFGYARHEDLTGRPARFPAQPSMRWLNTHPWQWQIGKIDQALESARGEMIIFAGTAYNMFTYLDRFDLLLLLRIDGHVRDTRLADPRRTNVFGRVGDSAAWSATWHRHVEVELLSRGAQCIDANAPIESVVEEVIAKSRSLRTAP